MSARSPRTFLPFIAASAAMLMVGLLLGAGRDAEDASAINSASKVLLTIGLLALVASCIAEAVRRHRARPGRTAVRRVG